MMKDIDQSGKRKRIIMDEKFTASPNLQPKKSPYQIDLRKKNIPERLTKTKSMIDVVSQEKGETMIIPQQKNKTPHLLGIGVLGLLIIFAVNIAATYGKGQKLIAQVGYSAAQGYQQLMDGSKKISEGKVVWAKNMFERSQSEFEFAQNQIWFFRTDEKVAGLTSVLDAGNELSSSGKLFTTLAEKLQGIGENFLSQEADYLATLKETATIIDELAGHLQKAQSYLSKVDKKVIPAEFLPKFEKGLESLKSVNEKMKKMQLMIPGMLELLNGDLLILLQNNDEVRPTGGFIGSYLKIRMENGLMKEMKLEDVYDIDDVFQENIEPPAEIKKLTSRWFFRDSNYSADFSISGKKALELYEKEAAVRDAGSQQENPQQRNTMIGALRTATPITVPETVLAINHALLGRLLDVTGPIEVPGLAHPLTSENYRQVFTYVIESKFEGYEDPKKILKEFMPVFQKRLFQKIHFQKIQQILLEEMVQKNILGFSHDEDIQQLFETLGIDGKMASAGEQEDYLNIVMSSFGGNKSDANMSQNVKHETFFQASGEIMDQLTIERTHEWSEKEFAKWRSVLNPFGYKDFPPHVVSIIGQGANKNAMRIYVPDGSILQSVEGIEIDKVATLIDPDLQKTYFSFDFVVESGQKKEIVLRYLLPFQLNVDPVSTYKFQLQKQPGIRPWKLQKEIHPHETMKLLNKFPANIGQDKEGNIKTELKVEKDWRMSTLWGEKT